MGELTDRERALLDFEARQWMTAAEKEDAAREAFGVGPVSYHQQLVALIGREEAIAYRPHVCARVARILASRRGRR